MKGFHLIVYGLKLLIGLVCLAATIYQCVILFRNFNSKDTIRKNTEVPIPDQLLSSTVIVCSDPPNTNISQDIVKQSVGMEPGKFILKSVGKMKTIFKGICDIVESRVFASPEEDEQTRLCFNSSQRLLLYNLFPSQKIFVADYHPKKAIEPTTITGSAYNAITVTTQVKEFLPDSGKCQEVGSHVPSSVYKASLDYEYCKQNNVTYHPIMDNYKKYENVTKTPFNPALKFQFAFGISTAFNMCPRPCIDVTYSTAVDKFFFSSEEEMVDATGCEMGNGVMVMSYQRIMDYELEDYIIKSVDLISGIGGAVGLWLGWSIMSLGYFLISALKTLNSFTVLK